MYFELVKKSTQTSAIKVAQGLVEKVGIFLDTLRKKGFQIPTIAFSCDNGYNSLALTETCHKVHLSYIGVPKRSEKIQINDEIYKIEQYIEEVFIIKEQAYLKKGEDNPKLVQQPFFRRVRATYCNQNRNIVLLFFRFNASKKVSIIYCPDKTIFAKTLRHHWFERTQIDWASPLSLRMNPSLPNRATVAISTTSNCASVPLYLTVDLFTFSWENPMTN